MTLHVSEIELDLLSPLQRHFTRHLPFYTTPTYGNAEMEIDATEASYRDTVQETSIKHAAARPVQLKEDDPYDLEQYIGQYAGTRG